MRVIGLIFLLSLPISAISLSEIYESYKVSMDEQEMPALWKALGTTVNRFYVHYGLKIALNNSAEYQDRIDSLSKIYTTVILPLMKFPTSDILSWQGLIYGEMQKLRNVQVKPLPPAESMGFDFVDDAIDPPDLK